MMKKIFFASILFILLFTPQFEAAAQSTQTSTDTQITFDMTGFPQWAKDIRRFDIIAFGTFPFSIFTVTFITDMFRWYYANGMDVNDMRYAPWPLKSAGGVEMTGEEYQRTILLAVGLSLTLALTDLIIVKVRQSIERRRIESRATGSVNVNTEPYENGEIIDDDDVEQVDDQIDESAIE